MGFLYREVHDGLSGALGAASELEVTARMFLTSWKKGLSVWEAVYRSAEWFFE